MKIKYIDKRHWRRLIERDYIEVKVNNNRFKRYYWLGHDEKGA